MLCHPQHLFWALSPTTHSPASPTMAPLTRRHSATLLAPWQIGIGFLPSRSEARFHVLPGRIAPLMRRAAICCFLLLWLFCFHPLPARFKCRHCTLLKYAKRPEQGRRTERRLFSPENAPNEQDSGNRPRMSPNRTSSSRKTLKLVLKTHLKAQFPHKKA